MAEALQSTQVETVNRPANPNASTKPINVCFLIDRLSLAGTETQLLHLIREMDRTQFRPHLALLDGTSDQSKELEPDCCPVLRLGVRKIRSIRAIKSAMQFKNYLQANEIDILQAYFPDSKLFGFAVAKLAQVPHFIRNRRNLGYSQSSFDRMVGRMCSKSDIKTAANSEACRQAIIEQEHAKPESVVVIPNGIDLRRFANVNAVRENAMPLRIGMVANLRPVKDPTTLLQAAIQLSEEFEGLQLELAGDGELRPKLQQMIDNFNLQNQFKLIGKQRDVPRFLETLDVAVLSSTSEGLSNAVIEYMASGRPIVATNVGGNSELIKHEVDGLLVEPGNTEQFVKAIRRLLVDRQLASRFGEAARIKALANYGLRQQAERFETLWTSLVKPKPQQSVNNGN